MPILILFVSAWVYLKVLFPYDRSSRRKVLYKKGVLKNFANLQENTCARVSFLIKLQALLKKRPWHSYFPMNFKKFLITPPFSIEHLRWLLLLWVPLTLLILQYLAFRSVSENERISFSSKSYGLSLNVPSDINPFVPNAPFLYHLKTLEKRKVFWCFLGVEKGCIGNKWVKRI